MELFLNLAWGLLVLPAYCLWRSGRSMQRESQFSSRQCLLALASMLVLLFPVISATDDLLAMRTEMEESAPGKRTVRQAASDRCSVCDNRFQGPAALLGAAESFAPGNEQGVSPRDTFLILHAGPSILCAGRAPPCPGLA